MEKVKFWNGESKVIFEKSYFLTLLEPISQNGQTYSKNPSAIYQRIVWVCVTILWDWRLKGLTFEKNQRKTAKGGSASREVASRLIVI